MAIRVILAAKSTDAGKSKSKPGGIAVRIGWSYFCARGPPRLSSSLEVLRANLIVAWVLLVGI